MIAIDNCQSSWQGLVVLLGTGAFCLALGHPWGRSADRTEAAVASQTAGDVRMVDVQDEAAGGDIGAGAGDGVEGAVLALGLTLDLDLGQDLAPVDHTHPRDGLAGAEDQN